VRHSELGHISNSPTQTRDRRGSYDVGWGSMSVGDSRRVRARRGPPYPARAFDRGMTASRAFRAARCSSLNRLLSTDRQINVWPSPPFLWAF